MGLVNKYVPMGLATYLLLVLIKVGCWTEGVVVFQ